MTLVDKLRDFGRKASMASILAILPNIAYSEQAPEPKQPDKESYQTQKPDSLETRTYTIEDFKKVLGDKRLSKIEDHREVKITEKWDKFKEDYKKALIEIYTDSDKFYKDRLTKELRKEYEEFSKTEFPNKTTDKKESKNQGLIKSLASSIIRNIGEASLEEQYPWIVDGGNLSTEERLSIYMDLRFKKMFRSQDDETKG